MWARGGWQSPERWRIGKWIKEWADAAPRQREAAAVSKVCRATKLLQTKSAGSTCTIRQQIKERSPPPLVRSSSERNEARRQPREAVLALWGECGHGHWQVAGRCARCWAAAILLGEQMAMGHGGEGLLSRTNQTVTDGAAGTAAGHAGECRRAAQWVSWCWQWCARWPGMRPCHVFTPRRQGCWPPAPPPLHTAEGKKRAFVFCYSQCLRDDIAVLDLVHLGHVVYPCNKLIWSRSWSIRNQVILYDWNLAILYVWLILKTSSFLQLENIITYPFFPKLI